jgi:hypothetical protein
VLGIEEGAEEGMWSVVIEGREMEIGGGKWDAARRAHWK